MDFSNRLRLDVGHQAVADTGFGDDKAGLGGIGFEFFAQVRDVHAQVVGLLDVARAPDFFEDLPVG